MVGPDHAMESSFEPRHEFVTWREVLEGDHADRRGGDVDRPPRGCDGGNGNGSALFWHRVDSVADIDPQRCGYRLRVESLLQ